jgi:hypothetical protein
VNANSKGGIFLVADEEYAEQEQRRQEAASMKRWTVVIGCLCGIVFGVLIAPTLPRIFGATSSAKGDGFGAAAEWSALSVNERVAYMEGYTDGYSIGASAACDNADQLFNTKGQVLPNGTLSNPVELCDAALDHFTRMGHRGKTRASFSVYSDAITEFYQKYPQYKNAPFSFLTKLLSDKNYQTADQLFQKLERHDLQATF